MVGSAFTSMVGVVVTFILTQWKLVLIGLLLALLGVQTTRLAITSEKFSVFKAEAAEASRKAEEASRAKEQEWQDKANQTAKAKDETILNINARLDDALGKLRDRPERPAGGVLPTSPGTITSSTGAGLYRDDGEFLVRFASRAATVAAERDACYALYEQVRAGQQVPNR